MDLLYAFFPLGYILSGRATGLLGPAPVSLIGGLTVIVAALALPHPRIRDLD